MPSGSNLERRPIGRQLSDVRLGVWRQAQHDEDLGPLDRYALGQEPRELGVDYGGVVIGRLVVVVVGAGEGCVSRQDVEA